MTRLSRQLIRLGSMMRAQGAGPFLRKTGQKIRAEAQRKAPFLRRGPEFTCPCCGRVAAFISARGRSHSECPQCGAKERHRLQMLVIRELFHQWASAETAVLHVAPEKILQNWLRQRSRSYVALDLARNCNMNHGRLELVSDLRQLALSDYSFDFVLCSHVLEHIPEDELAIREIYRVLKPGGLALLPVPIVGGNRTIEYGAPRPLEEYHVRAPGLDYFDRYREAGFQVEVRTSLDYPAEYQLFCYEDRSGWPDAQRPDLPSQPGRRHCEFVPLSRKP